MEDLSFWLTPILLLPGVGLLVMSTSVRYGQIHEEFHRLHDHHSECAELVNGHLLERAKLFRNALVSLYVSVALFSLSSLIGAIATVWFGDPMIVVVSLAGAGVFCLVFAAIELIRESAISLDIIREHSREAEKEVT